jgi:hypothetical protein
MEILDNQWKVLLDRCKNGCWTHGSVRRVMLEVRLVDHRLWSSGSEERRAEAGRVDNGRWTHGGVRSIMLEVELLDNG